MLRPKVLNETLTPIRVLIADDHSVVRFGLAHLLNAQPDICVVGEASDISELTHTLQTLRPDVIVLDMEMGETRGTDGLRTIRKASPAARVIIYTGFDDIDRAAEAVNLGVQGYLLKQSAHQDVIKAIRLVYRGGTVLEPEVATKLLEHIRNGQGGSETLSNRQAQVLRLLTEGKSNRSIAEQLHLSERTVKFHISALLTKLHAKNRTEAALIATERGLTQRRKNGSTHPCAPDAKRLS